MLSKNEIKYIQSLYQKKQRDREGVFVAEGVKMADELLNSALEIVKGYAISEWIQRHKTHEGIVTEVSETELQKLSNMKNPNEVLFVAKQKNLSHEPKLNDCITLVLDGIQDPGNMGTIIRIADWFGVKQIVASDESADVYNLKVVQASMGSICRVDVWYKTILDFISDINVPVYGAVLTGQSIYEADKINEGVLVIGNEGRGIHNSLLSYISKPITIPRVGSAESLNAAVATGIILSHLSKG